MGNKKLSTEQITTTKKEKLTDMEQITTTKKEKINRHGTNHNYTTAGTKKKFHPLNE
jgi:hypothetical protein